MTHFKLHTYDDHWGDIQCKFPFVYLAHMEAARWKRCEKIWNPCAVAFCLREKIWKSLKVPLSCSLISKALDKNSAFQSLKIFFLWENFHLRLVVLHRKSSSVAFHPSQQKCFIVAVFLEFCKVSWNYQSFSGLKGVLSKKSKLWKCCEPFNFHFVKKKKKILSFFENFMIPSVNILWRWKITGEFFFIHL